MVSILPPPMTTMNWVVGGRSSTHSVGGVDTITMETITNYSTTDRSELMDHGMIVPCTRDMYRQQLINFVREAASQLNPEQYYVHQVLAGLLDEILMHRKIQGIDCNNSPNNHFKPQD
jgi:hypothetical protein